MKETLHEILRYLGIAAFLIVATYLRWKVLEGRVKDIGDGGVQRLFEDKK